MKNDVLFYLYPDDEEYGNFEADPAPHQRGQKQGRTNRNTKAAKTKRRG